MGVSGCGSKQLSKLECYRRLPPPGLLLPTLPLRPRDVKRFSANSPCAHARLANIAHAKRTTPRTLCVSFQNKNFAQRFSLLNLTCRLLTRTRLALTRGSELSRTRERDADGDAFFLRVCVCVARRPRHFFHLSLSFMSCGPSSHFI